MKIEDLNINISDSEGNLRNMDEIISELEALYCNIPIRAMDPEETFYLHGRFEMLRDIIKYLKKI